MASMLVNSVQQYEGLFYANKKFNVISNDEKEVKIMGFGDLLKKAKEKAGEISAIAENLSGEISEKIQQNREEAQKRAEEMKKQEAQEAERLKQEKMAKILLPTCEKGDCLWNKSRFYFTCPEDCECERKKFTKKDWGGEIAAPEFWPYMKRLEAADKNESFSLGDLHKEIYADFTKEFLPQYEGAWKLAEVFLASGFEKEQNQLFDIMFAIAKMDKKKDIGKKIECLRNMYGFNRKRILSHEVFRKESLYDMSYEDFEYAVRIFGTVLDTEKLEEYFVDISNISIEQLYDADGNPKPAGIGGPQAGFYGDTIYNTVEMWSGENGENDRANH